MPGQCFCIITHISTLSQAGLWPCLPVLCRSRWIIPVLWEGCPWRFHLSGQPLSIHTYQFPKQAKTCSPETQDLYIAITFLASLNATSWSLQPRLQLSRSGPVLLYLNTVSSITSLLVGPFSICNKKIITAVELNLLYSTLTPVLSLITCLRLDHLFQKDIQYQTEAQKVVNKPLLQTVVLLY